MDIPELKAFISIAECQSFSRAAERLFLSQPAISKRIASLERELNRPLFDRIGRRIYLTEAGQALLPQARHILQSVEDSRRSMANLSEQIEGQLTIGTSHHIGLHHLPPVLRSFNNLYPQVQLDIRFMDSEAACQAVSHGELELGIVTLPSQAMENLQMEILWPDPLSIMTSRDHPLGKEKKLGLKKLSEYPAILPAQGTFTRERIEAAFRPKGIELEVSLSTNYLETIKMLVSVGLGWSVLPTSMADKNIVRHEIKELKLTRTLGLVKHKARTLSNAALALQKILKDCDCSETTATI